MAKQICTFCGQWLEDGADACPNCGIRTGASDGWQAPPEQAREAPPQEAASWQYGNQGEPAGVPTGEPAPGEYGEDPYPPYGEDPHFQRSDSGPQGYYPPNQGYQQPGYGGYQQQSPGYGPGPAGAGGYAPPNQGYGQYPGGSYQPPGQSYGAPPPGQQPYPPYSNGPQYPQRRGGGTAGALILVGVMLLLGITIISLAFQSDYDPEYEDYIFDPDGGWSGESGDGWEFDAFLSSISDDLYYGRTESALDTALQLPYMGFGEPENLRECAELFWYYDEDVYAFRLYLLAYGASGDTADLDMAMECASPSEVIGDRQMQNALEALLRKPFPLVSWEDVGQIRSFAAYSDSFAMSLSDPREVSSRVFQESEFTVTSTIYDSDIYYLYGLANLSFHTGVSQVEHIGLGGMPRLHTLSIDRLGGEGDLSYLAGPVNLEELSVGGNGVTSLYGLDQFPELRRLSLSGTSLEDLDELADCGWLLELELDGNDLLADIGVLEELPLLEALSLRGSAVSDLQVLNRLGSLKRLTVTGTELKDAAFLFDLTSLTSLELYDNSLLISVEGLGNLAGLEYLTLDCGDIRGVDEVAQLTGLHSLTLGRPQTLDMIGGLAELEELSLYNLSRLDSLDPLAGLSNLKTLVLERGNIHSSFGFSTANYSFSLSPLSGLTQLSYLQMQDMFLLGDCSAIFSLPSLEYLDISGSSLNAPQSSLSSLQSVRTLKMNKADFLYDVYVESDGFVTNIWYEHADPDGVARGLSGSTLERLEYRSVKLQDLAFVENLPSLAYLDLADNYITDLSPLAGCGALTYADLSDNPIRDWTAGGDDFILVGPGEE